jgi:hypothetical protein
MGGKRVSLSLFSKIQVAFCGRPKCICREPRLSVCVCGPSDEVRFRRLSSVPTNEAFELPYAIYAKVPIAFQPNNREGRSMCKGLLLPVFSHLVS